MHLLSLFCSFILAIYLIWDSARTPALYRKLKKAIDEGQFRERSRFYYQVYWFEGISAALALAALGFDRNRLNPARLGFDNSSFGVWLHPLFVDRGIRFVIGVALLFGMVAGTVLAVMIGRRRSPQVVAPAPRQSRFVPDFSYLLPTCGRERLLFALVAVSAGICEEIVFRAWLLDALHSGARLQGWPLVLVASVAFGVGHYYQGVAGVLSTTFLGLVFCGLYIVTGTLLLPILVHTLVDLRWAVLPSIPGLAPQRPA
jgi:membrane protease YdiL (CAAX protease family)